MSEAAARIPTSSLCLSHQPVNLRLMPAAPNGGWNPQRGFRHGNFKPDREPAVPPALALSIARSEAEQPNRARSLRRHVGSRYADSNLQFMPVAPTGGFQPPACACRTNRRIPTSSLCLSQQPEDGTPKGVSVMTISSRTTNWQFRQHWRRRLRGLRLNNQTAHGH